MLPAALRMRGAPLSLIAAPILELLTAHDTAQLDETREALELILLTRLPSSLLRQALPGVSDENHRGVIAHFLKLPSPVEVFWQDLLPDDEGRCRPASASPPTITVGRPRRTRRSRRWRSAAR